MISAERSSMTEVAVTDQAAVKDASAPGLDRRALWLSLGGGTLSGLLFVWSDLLSALGYKHPVAAGDNLSDIGSALNLLVLPIVIPLLARRYPFLWVVLALAVDLIWSVSDRIVAHNWLGLWSDTASNSTEALTSLLLLSAPISLGRYLLQRHREHAVRVRLAQQQAMQAAPEEGVWPPPPIRPSS